jgi:general transcription factor 3C polypeptide 3 (transcription factor C subunit 4)
MRSKIYVKVAVHCRRLSQLHQFRIEPLLLLQGAIQGGGASAHDVWCTLNLQRYIHREMTFYEAAIDVEGNGMHFSDKFLRWSIAPKVGISRLLDDVDIDGGEDERGMDEDDDNGGGVREKQKKGKKGRKSTAKARESMAGATLGDALEMDEDMDFGAEGEGIDGEGEGEGVEDDEGGGVKREVKRPTKVSPAWSAVYGQYMLSSASHHGALCESLVIRRRS